jgi:hypothetical protein
METGLMESRGLLSYQALDIHIVPRFALNIWRRKKIRRRIVSL